MEPSRSRYGICLLNSMLLFLWCNINFAIYLIFVCNGRMQNRFILLVLIIMKYLCIYLNRESHTVLWLIGTWSKYIIQIIDSVFVSLLYHTQFPIICTNQVVEDPMYPIQNSRTTTIKWNRIFQFIINKFKWNHKMFLQYSLCKV